MPSVQAFGTFARDVTRFYRHSRYPHLRLVEQRPRELIFRLTASPLDETLHLELAPPARTETLRDSFQLRRESFGQSVAAFFSEVARRHPSLRHSTYLEFARSFVDGPNVTKYQAIVGFPPRCRRGALPAYMILYCQEWARQPELIRGFDVMIKRHSVTLSNVCQGVFHYRGKPVTVPLSELSTRAGLRHFFDIPLGGDLALVPRQAEHALVRTGGARQTVRVFLPVAPTNAEDFYDTPWTVLKELLDSFRVEGPRFPPCFSWKASTFLTASF